MCQHQQMLVAKGPGCSDICTAGLATASGALPQWWEYQHLISCPTLWHKLQKHLGSRANQEATVGTMRKLHISEILCISNTQLLLEVLNKTSRKT